MLLRSFALPRAAANPFLRLSSLPTKSARISLQTASFTTSRPSPSLSTSKPFSSTPLNRRRILLATTALGLTLPLASRHKSPIKLDASPPAASYSHSRDARNPLVKDSKTLNPSAVKQISLGSILGLGAGVVVSAFSRTLTLLIGVGIVFVQYAARKGYNIVPTERIQGYVKGINLRNLINDNVAFKLSFGLMFALTAFGEF